MSKRRKGPARDAKGRFTAKRKPSPTAIRGGGLRVKRVLRGKPVKPRDAKGRFVSSKVVRTEYVREIEALRREIAQLKERDELREKDIARNYKKRGGAFDRYVNTLALGQRAKIEKYLDDVYDGEIDQQSFVTLAVAVGLTVREAWAVLYS